MTILRIVGFLALAFSLSAQTRSYRLFPYVQGSILAPLPDGGLAVGITGQDEGAVLVLDGRGNVAAAQSLGSLRPVFLSTNPAGEISLALAEREDLLPDRVMKLRRDLTAEWTRRLVPPSGSRLFIVAGATARDGGVLLVGRLDEAVFVTKLDGKGTAAWTTVLEVSGGERLAAIREAADGGVVVGGSEGSAWLARLDRDGKLSWQQRYPPLRRFRALTILSNGSIAAAGQAPDGAFLAMIGRDGKLLWSRATTEGESTAVVETEGGLVAAFAHGPARLTLVAMKNDGTLRWQRRLEGEPTLFLASDRTLLAVRRGRLALSMAFNTESVPVLDVDPATGSSECGWLVAGALEFQEVSQVRVEPVTAEVRALRLRTEAANVRLAPLEIQAGEERCLPMAPAPPLLPPPSAKEVEYVLPDYTETTKRYAALLLGKDFAALEETANRLLREQPVIDPIRPNLALASFVGALQNDATVPEDQRLAVLRRWVAAYPRSSAAKIVLAQALYSAAYERRGGGFANTVTDTGWAGYRAFMHEARGVLNTAGEAAHGNAEYWSLRISLAAELGGEDKREVALRAVALLGDPDLALAGSIYQEPKWNGSAEAVVAFADEAARLTRAKYGDAVYAWLADRHRGEPYPFDWPRVQKGFEDMIRLDPRFLPSFHRYARLAWKRKDQAKARELFLRDELAWYRDADRIWDHRDVFEVARRWALGEPALLPAPSARPAARPSSPQPDLTLAQMKKIFGTPVFVKAGTKRIEGKILSFSRELRILYIGMRERLDPGIEPAGLEVLDGEGKVLTVIKGRWSSEVLYPEMEDLLETEPTAATVVLP